MYPEQAIDPPEHPDSVADYQTVPCEICEGALVEVTVWVDDNGQADFRSYPVCVMYKGQQVNDLILDGTWAEIHTQVNEWISIV